jgi:hypothetical protein
VITIFINIGMWFERFVIIVTSLAHEYEPWQWRNYSRRWVEMAILAGSFAGSSCGSCSSCGCCRRSRWPS